MQSLKVHPIFLILKENTDKATFDEEINSPVIASELPVFLQLKSNGSNILIKGRENSIKYDDVRNLITEHYDEVFSKSNPEMYSKFELVRKSEAWFIDFNEFKNQANSIDNKGKIYKFGQKRFFICPVALILSDKNKEFAVRQFIGWNERAVLLLYESNNANPTDEEKEIEKFQKIADKSKKFEKISLNAWENIRSLWFEIFSTIDNNKIDELLLFQPQNEETY